MMAALDFATCSSAPSMRCSPFSSVSKIASGSALIRSPISMSWGGWGCRDVADNAHPAVQTCCQRVARQRPEVAQEYDGRQPEQAHRAEQGVADSGRRPMPDSSSPSESAFRVASRSSGGERRGVAYPR